MGKQAGYKPVRAHLFTLGKIHVIAVDSAMLQILTDWKKSRVPLRLRLGWPICGTLTMLSLLARIQEHYIYRCAAMFISARKSR